jgi:hypothetical protein
MSTKTLRKRIALVAVSALGAGLLSVAPANAADETFSSWATSSYCGLYVGATPTTDATLGSTITSIVMPVGGVLKPDLSADEMVRVTSPLLITQATGGTISAGGLSSITSGAGADEIHITATAVGTATIKIYRDASDTTASDSVSVSVVASCGASTFSLANSFVEMASTSSVADSLVDEISSATNTGTVFLNIVAKDANSNVLPIGTWTVSASNGALVGITADASAPACGDLSSAAVSGTGTDISVAICQGVDYAPQSTVVTVSYGSAVVVTKSTLITGELASVAVSSPSIVKTGGTYFKAFVTNAYDAAGNRVATSLNPLSTTLGQVVQNLAAGTTSATTYTVLTNSATCGATAGSAKVKLYGIAASSGKVITSNEFEIKCAGGLYTFKASMDKAVYAPGDIATVTITGYDSKGNLVYDAVDTDNSGAAGDTYNALGETALHAVTGSNLEAVVAPATTDQFYAGVKKYLFKVGQNAGSYQLAVDLPDSGDDAKTVAYSISGGGVSNADVLKAIVSLIASINKQIAALQKALLKR